MLFLVEHGSSVTPSITWEGVLRIAKPGDSIFEWVPKVGWVFLEGF